MSPCLKRFNMDGRMLDLSRSVPPGARPFGLTLLRLMDSPGSSFHMWRPRVQSLPAISTIPIIGSNPTIEKTMTRIEGDLYVFP